MRLLCATHADIPRAIVDGSFRQGPLYRINTVQILLPPLRERRDDILLLANHLLKNSSAEMGREVRAIAAGASDELFAHTSPGNVRELNHVIQRAVALAESDTITSFASRPPLQCNDAGGFG